MRYLFWLSNLFTVADQVLNVLFWIIPLPGGRLGSGDPDQTLSHYWATLSRRGVGWARRLCRVLTQLERVFRFVVGVKDFQLRHCYTALVADVEGFNTPEMQAHRVAKGEQRIISCLR